MLKSLQRNDSHCNGTGQILEDFGFASSLAEGEMRSKAAKLKLPMNGKNKHNNEKHNKVFNHQNTQNNQKNDYDRRNHAKQDDTKQENNVENQDLQQPQEQQRRVTETNDSIKIKSIIIKEETNKKTLCCNKKTQKLLP